jgi:hypothetical protein
MEKYEGTLPDGRLLPVTTNQYSNVYLKKIGELYGLKKKLTFHLSRHTFATLTLSRGVYIESVSKMLGHTNIQTTQIYARITNDKIGNDMADGRADIRDRDFVLSRGGCLSRIQGFKACIATVRACNCCATYSRLSFHHDCIYFIINILNLNYMSKLFLLGAGTEYDTGKQAVEKNRIIQMNGYENDRYVVYDTAR